MDFRYDWTVDEVVEVLTSPLEELCKRAKAIHHKHAVQDLQKNMLVSIKTGDCPEDCGYCSQSAHHKTELDGHALMDPEAVVARAKEAKEMGAGRVCMGGAWRCVPQGVQFEKLLQIIRGVAAFGMEACGSFGAVTDEQLKAMKEAGLTAYNHNLDTGREYYPKVVTTRSYDERLKTLRAVRKAGVQICCGGILGLGESLRDRAGMLVELSNFNPHPESVPINLLVPIPGTPLENAKPISFEEFLRVVATTRILLPASRVRLSAGRNTLSEAQQQQCFNVGANSVFIGEKLLTVPN